MQSERSGDVTVRLARADDVDVVAQLTKQLGYDVSSSAVAARLSRILPRPDQQFFIAEYNGRAIGWLHATRAEFVETEAFVLIAGLVVDKEHRGRGAGHQLMDHAEAWARRQGCSLVRLSSTSTRTISHRFYERLGYANVKTQYAFAKYLDGREDSRLSALVPRVDQ